MKKSQITELWEILVPCVRNDGRPIKTRFHRIFDKKVIEIAGGLTIFRPSIGKWVSPDKELFVERMIPVRIMCSEFQINSIADYAAKYYEQKAIMFYQVSPKSIIKHYEN